MAYKIIVTNPARKQLLKLSSIISERIQNAIDALQETPRPNGGGAESIKGLSDTFRIRVGDYRIVYSLHDDELLILIVRVAHRREVYRKL